MAFSAIDRMVIPGATGGSGPGILMPKLQYRFRVTFTGIGTNGGSDGLEITKQVIDVSRPNVSFPEISLPIYNSTVYLAGKPTWEPITMNIRDDVNGDVAGVIGRQVQKQMDFQEQASAATGGDYKFKTIIEILDGGNGATAVSVLETWELYGCYLASVNYNQLSYSANEAVTMACTIRYDNALQYGVSGTGGDNVGASYGRTLGTNITI